jgi:flagellin-like hook-associated protein FlgL
MRLFWARRFALNAVRVCGWLHKRGRLFVLLSILDCGARIVNEVRTMVITHNIPAMRAGRNFLARRESMAERLEKLSSGRRINRAGDDAAGLAVSEKMRAQIRGLSQAARNAHYALNLIDTAEGALSEIHELLRRQRVLAVQAANDTNTGFDRAELQRGFESLTAEIDRIAYTTQYNVYNTCTGHITTLEAQTAHNCCGGLIETAKIRNTYYNAGDTDTVSSANEDIQFGISENGSDRQHGRRAPQQRKNGLFCIDFALFRRVQQRQ